MPERWRREERKKAKAVNYITLGVNQYSLLFSRSYIVYIISENYSEANVMQIQSFVLIFDNGYKYCACKPVFGTLVDVLLPTNMSKSSSILFLVVAASWLVCVQSQKVFFGSCPNVATEENFDMSQVRFY